MSYYLDFLRKKIKLADSFGFDVSDAEINQLLKPHQRDIVRWLVRMGRAACFAAFGLGKSVIQVETVRLTRERAGGMALIVIPLGVRQEFMRDAAMLGVKVKFIRRIEEADDPEGIYLTNYETVRDGKLDPRSFTVASLDEAACLRGFGGTKTFREFMALFAGDRKTFHARVAGDCVAYRFVATATPSPNDYIELLAYSAFLGVMDVGQAKAQPLDAKVLTPAGWRFMGDLQVGDQVIAGDGTPTRVLGVYPQGERPIFRIEFSDGTSTEADAEHLWLTQTQYERNNERRWRDRNQGEPGDRYATVRTTAAIAATLRTDQGGKNHTVPLVAPVQLPAQPVLIDPWLLGFLLGDACIRDTSVVLSTVDEWIVEEAAARLSILGLRLHRTTEAGCDYSITSTGKKGGRGPGSNALLAALREYGLLGKRSWEKSIPSSYIINDVPTRLAILQGLMDADGTVHEDGTMIRFSSSSRILAEQVQELVRSLGGTATIRTVATTGRDAHLVTLSLPAGMVPFRLPRKADRVTPRDKYPPARYIIAVEPVGEKPAQCIAIEHPSRLYVTDDFVVTHNTRFFKRNSEKADELTIHPHKEREFWLWVASWGLFVQRPSDLGHSDEGYELPELEIHWHEIPADHEDAGFDFRGQGLLLKQQALGVVDAAREKRESLPQRVAKMMELRAIDPDAHRILWHDLEAERQAIERAIPDVVSVYGAQDDDTKAERIIDFSDGRVSELAGKPVMLGSGCNFQRHCSWAIFLGIGHKFNDFIQAIHRLHRFLQPRRVRIDLIYTEAERGVRRILEDKWDKHNQTVAKMTEIIREYGLSAAAMQQHLQRALGVERVEVSGDSYRLINNDAVIEASAMPDNSLDLIVTSVPFATQYEYSPNYCYDEQTQVLTRRGWLSFGALLADDQVATMNPATRALEWQVPQRRVWMPYRGTLLHFKNRANFDLLVTPDHKMIADSRVGNRATGRKAMRFDGVRASTIANGFVHRKWRFINTCEPGVGAEPRHIVIPAQANGARGPKRVPLSQIGTEDFLELAGWYLSEGYCDALESGHAGRVTIAQCDVNPDHREAIADLFRRIGLGVQTQGRAIVAHNKNLAAFLLEQFGGGSYCKRIPRWVKDLHPRLLTILRDTMMKGDGNKDGFAYTSFSERLRDDFQELCILTGWRAAIRANVIGIGRKQLFPEVRERPAAVEYQGMVGCVTVPNGTIVVRRNGIACVSGNCDFGHTDTNDHFFEQMDFLTPELLRALKPGRVAAIHVKDRIVPGGMTGLGFQTVYPFHARCIEHYTRHGFGYMGMITIVTDVVRENNQTYRLGWSEVCKDGSKLSAGLPEYLLLFRKTPTDTSNAYADEPVTKTKASYTRSRWQTDAHGFWRSGGNRLLTPEELETLDHDVIFRWFRDYHLENIYDYEHHVQIGETIDGLGRLPVTFMLLQPPSWIDDVWTDVARMRTLNTLQSAKGKEQHLCPLPFDIVDRVIERFSNPGDTVFDPFGGIGTVPYRAILKGRRGLATELSPRYFADAAHWCQAAEREMSIPDLFATL